MFSIPSTCRLVALVAFACLHIPCFPPCAMESKLADGAYVMHAMLHLCSRAEGALRECCSLSPNLWSGCTSRNRQAGSVNPNRHKLSPPHPLVEVVVSKKRGPTPAPYLHPPPPHLSMQFPTAQSVGGTPVYLYVSAWHCGHGRLISSTSSRARGPLHGGWDVNPTPPN